MGNRKYSSEKIKTVDAIETLSQETTRDIPQDIVAEILGRLPVKSLLKFKCVAKSWLALIASPVFIKTHAKYSTLDPNFSNYRLLLGFSYSQFQDHVKLGSVSLALRNLSTDAADFDRPEKRTRRFHIHGSCNGLLCVSVHDSGIKDVFLWNPTLRVSKKLPPPCAAENFSVSKYCIVYDEPKDDYKVVGLFGNLSHRIPYVLESTIVIYSLKNDSWKRIKDFKGRFHWPNFMVYANGRLCFVTDCKGKHLSIVSLDLENEFYGIVGLLTIGQQRCYSSCLGVLKGCISVLYSYRDCTDIWVLKEYTASKNLGLNWLAFLTLMDQVIALHIVYVSYGTESIC